MLKTIHSVAGTLALLVVAVFWPSTSLSELFATEAPVTSAKTAIP